MDFPSKDEIRELMQKRDDHCVSIFLPTHRAGRETEQDPIRFDNLLRRAERELAELGLRTPDARELLSPAYALANDGFFTRHLADGLTVFASKDLFKYYRAPIHFDERMIIGKRFVLKPLVPILGAGNRFYVLAVSRKSVRLLQGTEFGVTEIDLEGVPRSMDEALGGKITEGGLFRGVPGPLNARGNPYLWGHGGGVGSEKDYLLLYFRKLREALHPYLREEKAPLIFAGVEYLFPLFKDVNLYQHYLPEALEGNPDGLDAQELHRKALEIARPHLEKSKEDAIRRISDMSCNGQCSFSLEKIVQGAFEGRIDTLLVNTAAARWGKFDKSSFSVEVHEDPAPGDEDLIDLAAVETFLAGGNVFPLDLSRMPRATEMSALFRY